MFALGKQGLLHKFRLGGKLMNIKDCGGMLAICNVVKEVFLPEGHIGYCSF